MSTDEQANNLNKQLSKALDDSIHDIDADTRLQLRKIREQAVSAQKSTGENNNIPWLNWQTRLPLVGLTTAAALSILWITTPMLDMRIGKQTSPDLAIAPEFWQEDPELIEDVEFIAWLIEQEMEASEIDNTNENNNDAVAG